MTRRTLPITLAAVCALSLAISCGASAQEPAAAGASTEAARTAEAETAEATTAGSKSLAHDPNCIRDTGSLIRERTSSGKRACLPVTGRSYSREDLERTGSTSTADALRKLDTSVR